MESNRGSLQEVPVDIVTSITLMQHSSSLICQVLLLCNSVDKRVHNNAIGHCFVFVHEKAFLTFMKMNVQDIVISVLIVSHINVHSFPTKGKKELYDHENENWLQSLKAYTLKKPNPETFMFQSPN